LAETALQVPDGWYIVLCSHPTPLRVSEYPASWGDVGGVETVDVDVARGLLNAFINKTTYTYNGTLGADEYALNIDFTGYKGEVVCWLSGHVHMDGVFSMDGLNVVVTANCSSHVASSAAAPAKTPGTDTEYIMDFLCVNKLTRECNVVRLGAATQSERTFNF
jgi:hypothetical protein